jgi:hypothetical protein
LFRRTEKTPAPAEDPATTGKSADKGTGKGTGKGRPTPTRKEAEAAARERARAAMDAKAAKKLLRERRVEENRKLREGLKSGDERFLPARDRGPVRRYIRDWIDSRIVFAELLLPLLLSILVLQSTGRDNLVALSNLLWSLSVLVLVADTLWMRFRLMRELKRRFPDESLKGTTFYAFTRALQFRFMRLPKPKVRLGGRPR